MENEHLSDVHAGTPYERLDSAMRGALYTVRNMIHLLSDEPVAVHVQSWKNADAAGVITIHVESYKFVVAMIKIGGLYDITDQCKEQYSIQTRWDGSFQGKCFNGQQIEFGDHSFIHATIRC
jgi:hypothetical protein